VTTRASRIEGALRARFFPTHLVVEDESHLHAGPPRETHFRVVVVSAEFAGHTSVERHRLVHAALTHELSSGLHALSVRARTPAEWDADGATAPASPPCHGGSKGA
jgi:stress-induced morphogen